MSCEMRSAEDRAVPRISSPATASNWKHEIIDAFRRMPPFLIGSIWRPFRPSFSNAPFGLRLLFPDAITEVRKVLIDWNLKIVLFPTDSSRLLVPDRMQPDLSLFREPIALVRISGEKSHDIRTTKDKRRWRFAANLCMMTKRSLLSSESTTRSLRRTQASTRPLWH